jgi:peptidoglycan/LPS O-acetylase OafA/YrhL
MKILDRIVAALILVMGCLHSSVSSVFHGRYDGAGMWFLSGGLMMIFLGRLNLARTGSPGAGARRAALAANLLALGFSFALVPIYSMRQNPQIMLFIVLVVLATLMTVLRRTA